MFFLFYRSLMRNGLNDKQYQGVISYDKMVNVAFPHIMFQNYEKKPIIPNFLMLIM